MSLGATLPAGHADPMIGTSRNTYGLPGLIDMPTAEMRPDGEFSASMSFISGGTQRSTLAFQIAPRLSGTFRYSRVPDLATDPLTGRPTALYDRAFDLRWNFLDEGKYTPSVALGLRSFIGTGIYSGEYLVATKSLTSRLRATAGLGWGRLGSFGGHGNPFGDRPDYDYSATSGKLNSDMWFRGPVAPFFGLSYQLTDNWTLKAEYSSDGYLMERSVDDYDSKTPFNFAVDYRVNDFTDVQGFVLNGSRVGLQVTFAVNPKHSPFPSGLEKAPLPVKPRPSLAADPEGWSGAWASDPTAQPAIQKALADALAKDGQILESLVLTPKRAELRIRNQRYQAEPEAIGRAVRIATRALPSSVDTIVIVPVAAGMDQASLVFRRDDVEKLENRNAYDMLAHVQIEDTKGNPQAVPTPGAYPRFLWSLGPYMSVSLFDQNQPFRAELGAELAARYEAAPGIVFSGAIRQKAFSDLQNDSDTSAPGIPHVRSDNALYARHGDLAISQLQGAWYTKLGNDVYGRVTTGLLEKMYGGVSSEILWKPAGGRLALGLEADWVKKRDYDQRFDFLDYETLTGLASAYYDFGGGYIGQLDFGRYLARDWGGTLSLSRTFANGWKIGAYATVTDLSARDYGAGSFDKGIMLTIPIGWATGEPSTGMIDGTLRSLQRDSGARLDVDGRLYDTVRSAQGNALYDNWGRFWR